MTSSRQNTTGPLINQGKLLEDKGMNDRALELYTSAICEDAVAAYTHRASLYTQLGRKKEALYDLNKILEFNPYDARVLYILSRDQPSDELKKRIYLDQYDEVFDLAYGLYAIANCDDHAGRFDMAFEGYKKAGKILRDYHKYDPQMVENFHAELPDLLGENLSAVDQKQVIFIVGLPRSGSTLLETMLGMHSQIHQGGESTYIQRFINIDGGRLHFRIGEFMQQTHKTNLPVVTNKFLYNFYHIPIIRKMIPNAKIIHIIRNPLDNLFSCFQVFFMNGNQWTYSLDDLGHYYNQYVQLMDFRRKHYEFLDVCYEKLVENPEGELRRILRYCGLEYEEICLSFSESKSAVKTTSNVQIRNPLNRSSIKKSERYEEHLSPIIKTISSI